jgi:hypothetical protein
LAEFFSGAIELEDFENLDVDEFRGLQAPGSAASAITLRRGENATLRNCTAAPGTGVFLEAHGVSGKKLLIDSDLANAGTVLKGDAAGFVLRGNYLPQRTAAPGQPR